MLRKSARSGLSLFENGHDALGGGNQNTELSGEAEHGTGEEVAFIFSVGSFEIALERRFSFVRKASGLEKRSLGSIGGQTDTGHLRQLNGFVDDVLRVCLEGVIVENLADGFVERGCHQAEGTDEDELFPNIRLDVSRPIALDTGAAEEAQDFVRRELRMKRVGPKKDFACPSFLGNDTRPFDVSADIDAGREQDSVCDDTPHTRGDIDAIEQGQDNGVVADEGAQVQQCRREIKLLYANETEIGRRELIEGIDGERRLAVEVAVVGMQEQAILLNGAEMLAAREKRNGAADVLSEQLAELTPEVATDTSDADDCDVDDAMHAVLL